MGLSLQQKIIKEDLEKQSMELTSIEFIEHVKENYKDCHFTDGMLKIVFIKISELDEYGYGIEWKIDDLIEINRSFYTQNGGSWYRKDGQLKAYNIKVVKDGKGNRATSIKLDGFNRDISRQQRTINKEIRDELKNEPCAILGIHSQNEVDHKNGKYNDLEAMDVHNQKKEDFQTLCKTANNAKRTHCKRCQDTGERYDAKQLGYCVSFICGDKYSPNCEGCYWHDPQKFNQKVSENFIKER